MNPDQNLSEYAKKYGQHLAGSNKSGFTPLDYRFPSILTDEEWAHIQKVEKFQRKRLFGFTTRELTQLDAISSRDLRTASLQNGIIPLISKDRWEKTPPKAFTRDHLYPLGNGKQGFWIMGNPEVEKIMMPSLILASRILQSSHLLHWLDALMYGERRQIPDERVPEPWDYVDTRLLKSFHPQSDYDPAVTAARRERTFELLITKWNLTYGFSSPTEDIRGPHHDYSHAPYAETFLNVEQMEYDKDTNPSWGIWIYLNYATIEALMRDDMNSVDRMSLEWQTATTIVHETMHAISTIVPGELDEPLMEEPYFENEAIAEVGFGYEHAVNGGTTRPFVTTRYDLPLGFWLQTEWPSAITDLKKPYEDVPILNHPSPSDFQCWFPIAVTLFSDIQQEEFWTIGIQNFGHGLFYFRNMQEGARQDREVVTKPGHNLYQWISTSGRSVRIKSSFSAFPDRSKAVQRKLEEVQQIVQVNQLAVFSPDEKRFLEFGKQLLLSSQVEGQFWGNTVQQRNLIDELFEHIEEIHTRSAGTGQIFQSMINLMQQIRDRHEIMVSTTPSLEAINGTFYLDRRRDLLTWNRGTRLFIKSLQDLCKSVPDKSYMETLNEELMLFEKCRMLLWHPESPIQEGPDYEEIQLLTRARTAPELGLSVADCRQICFNLSNDPKTSITVLLCAGIVIESTEPPLPDDLPRRYGEIERVVTRMQALRWGAGSGWTKFLESWEGLAASLLQNLRTQAEQHAAQQVEAQKQAAEQLAA